MPDEASLTLNGIAIVVGETTDTTDDASILIVLVVFARVVSGVGGGMAVGRVSGGSTIACAVTIGAIGDAMDDLVCETSDRR